jgi:hypothetical protein
MALRHEGQRKVCADLAARTRDQKTHQFVPLVEEGMGKV